MMDDRPVWEPSTEKEATYYDKLFGVVDRDKSVTLDGKEAVQFLAHSGLTKAQLKDVWSVASSPGQAVLQRQEFYVAMRAVALVQSGEALLTRQKIQETSTEPIAMAAFKGIPAPPIKLSKGKKPQATKKAKKTSKAASKKTADPVRATAGLKKPAEPGGTGNSSKKNKTAGAFCRNQSEGGKGAVKASEKTNTNRVVSDTTKISSPPKKVNEKKSDNDDSSSSSSSDSDDSGDDSGHSGSRDIDNDCGEEASSNKSDNARSIVGDAKIRGSGQGSSDSEGSFEGRKGSQKRKSRVGGECRNGDDEDSEQGSDSDKSSSSESGSDSSASSSKSLDDGGGDDGGTAPVVCNDEILSQSSSSSSSSSSSNEKEGPDPFTMSEKARARYQTIFSKIDASGNGSLSGKQVLELCVQSGLDKATLATIWRLSDLDEDRSLTAEEFGIAFHLIFCATQRKLEVPDELPQSLWPTGYVPPSVLARRKEEAERKRHEEEQERHRNDETVSDKNCKTTTNNPTVDTAKKKKKKKKKQPKKAAGAVEKGTKAAGGGLGANKETQEEKEEEERKEKAAREAASLQKREELAKKHAEKSAKNKNKRTQTGNRLLAAAATAKPPPAREEVEAPQTTSADKTNARVDTLDQPLKKEGASRADDVEAAVAAAAASSPRSDASGATSSVGEGATPKKKQKKKKKEKKRQPPPVSDTPSSMTERSDAGGGSGARAPETAVAVPPQTMAERRARKAEARAAKIEAAQSEKEMGARDARIAELDLQDCSKTFAIKTMDPMGNPDDCGSIHMLSDPSGGGDRGPLSFARLSAPLPYLTPHPGRSPCLQRQEFSVSFPSGARRASSLTPSLGIRLGPPPAPPHPADSERKSGKGVGVGDDLIRCPECAEFLASDQIVQHIRSTCRLLPCTLCSRLLLPADLERHLEEVCPNRRRSCTRCGEAVILSKFARHEKEGGCPRRVVPCSACEAFCFADELTGHKATACPERELRCPSCGDALPAKRMAEHAESLCRSTTWTCGCGEGPSPLVDRPGHLRTCDAFIDAWEASIEKVIARMSKIEVIRNIGKVMIATRVENPGIALLALAESRGIASLAARRVNDSKSYIDEICLAADIINVEVFLSALKKPGKRGSGALWRTGI